MLLFCGQITGPGIKVPVKLGVGDTLVDDGVVDVGVVDVGDTDEDEDDETALQEICVSLFAFIGRRIEVSNIWLLESPSVMARLADVSGVCVLQFLS